jgi:tetratricopeptide (TPR) repeat protein
MKQLNSTGWRRTALVLLAAAFVGSGLSAQAAYVIMTGGQRVDGTDIRAKSDGEIILTTPQGQRSFYPGQYTKAAADKPPEIDKAAQLVAAKQYDEAIKLLEDVVLRYRFLDWDVQARAMLPQVYAKKGDMTGAIAAFDKLFVLSPKSKEEPALQWSYRETLLAAKQYDKLTGQLDQVVAAGSRTDAARAQVMRGDIKADQNQLEGAALDYLRTVVLFKTERTIQPEALSKAAQTLEKLRDPRAKDMYRMLVEEYPGTPEAEAAKAKL